MKCVKNEDLTPLFPPTSVKDVVDLLQTAYAKKLNGKVSGNYRTGDIRTNFADISNARKDLGFSPEVKFSEGIKRFSEWVVSQQNKKDKSASYEKSLDEMRERGLFIEKR
jgi:dTDP-L-rhamnose 4-epimerase